jgi:hypothetical protein
VPWGVSRKETGTCSPARTEGHLVRASQGDSAHRIYLHPFLGRRFLLPLRTSMRRGSLPDTGTARILLDEPEQLIVHAWKNLLVCVWLGDGPAHVMRKFGSLVELQAREVGPLSVVTFVLNVAVMPDEGRRQAYKDLAVAVGANIAHAAIVLELDGFVGSAVRALITGILLMTRHQHTVHVMSRVEDVPGWLVAKHTAATGVALDPAELTQLLARVRTEALAGRRHEAMGRSAG